MFTILSSRIGLRFYHRRSPPSLSRNLLLVVEHDDGIAVFRVEQPAAAQGSLGPLLLSLVGGVAGCRGRGDHRLGLADRGGSPCCDGAGRAQRPSLLPPH